MGTIGHIRSLDLTFNIFNLEWLIPPVASNNDGPNNNNPVTGQSLDFTYVSAFYILLLYTNQPRYIQMHKSHVGNEQIIHDQNTAHIEM